MLNLVGVYDCKVDDKGRIMFPSTLKRKLQSSVDEGFIIKQSVYNNCLEIFPMEEWKKLMGKIALLDPFQKNTDLFKRIFMQGHREVNLDSTGRFLIPKELKDFAGIDRDIILASSVNKIEVWEKGRYMEEVNKPVDFGLLAKEVMGEFKG